MFEIGDKVMYGTMGVCEIMDICVPDFEGATHTCYLLEPRYMKGTRVYAPTKNCTVSMRPVMSAEEAHDLIDSLHTIRVFEEQEKAECMKTYRSAIQSADGYLVAKLMKTLYLRKKQKLAEKKIFPNQEKELLNIAENLLHGEVAHCLNLPIETVPDYIMSRQDVVKKNTALVS